MLNENECKNSGGWFKDPFTGEDIGPSYPRAITCKSGDKWVQPAVMFKDGNIVKISGRCWNDDERQCYKEYRGKSNTISKPREHKQKAESSKQKPSNSIYHETPLDERTVTKFNPESAVSEQTLAIIACCDNLLGVSNLDGIDYALLTSKGSDIIYHVPRCLINNERFEELCNDCV